jgi:hypothetical protein
MESCVSGKGRDQDEPARSQTWAYCDEDVRSLASSFMEWSFLSWGIFQAPEKDPLLVKISVASISICLIGSINPVTIQLAKGNKHTKHPSHNLEPGSVILIHG